MYISRFFLKWHFGTEKTRDELRRQVYDAMAEEEKDVQGKPVPEDELGNGVPKSPEKEVSGSVQEESETGAGKESEGEQVQQNGQDTMEEAEQDGEAAEGSMFVALKGEAQLIVEHTTVTEGGGHNIQGRHWSPLVLSNTRNIVL